MPRAAPARRARTHARGWAVSRRRSTTPRSTARSTPMAQSACEVGRDLLPACLPQPRARERRRRERVAPRLPDAFVSCSSDVLPQIKEYERFSTTVVNAYVGPAVHRYLTRLERAARRGGLRRRLFVILSHGGVAPVAGGGAPGGRRGAVRSGRRRCRRGRSGGAAARRARPHYLRHGRDLAPTSPLVAGGEPQLAADAGWRGERVALRSLDIVTLGAGGGSIARLDRRRLLQVGPRECRRGAGPGLLWPRRHCGDRNRRQPGARLSSTPTNFLGGARGWIARPREAAVDRRGGASWHHAPGGRRRHPSPGQHRRWPMASGWSTVRRGVDPRRFALLAFGGAAGLHATEVARELEIPRVDRAARSPSVLSAWGMLRDRSALRGQRAPISASTP